MCAGSTASGNPVNGRACKAKLRVNTSTYGDDGYSTSKLRRGLDSWESMGLEGLEYVFEVSDINDTHRMWSEME